MNIKTFKGFEEIYPEKVDETVVVYTKHGVNFLFEIIKNQ
jgi:hypothetical protein